MLQLTSIPTDEGAELCCTEFKIIIKQTPGLRSWQKLTRLEMSVFQLLTSPFQVSSFIKLRLGKHDVIFRLLWPNNSILWLFRSLLIFFEDQVNALHNFDVISARIVKLLHLLTQTFTRIQDSGGKEAKISFLSLWLFEMFMGRDYNNCYNLCCSGCTLQCCILRSNSRRSLARIIWRKTLLWPR